MPAAASTPRTAGWAPTRAHVRSAGLAVGGLLASLVWHRPDLVVAVTPLAVIAWWGSLARPRSRPTLRFAVDSTRLREGEATHARYVVADGAGLRDLGLATRAAAWVQPEPSSGAVAQATGGEVPTEVGLPTRFVRWGEHPAGPATVAGFSAWAAYQWGPVATEAATVTVLPLAAVFASLAPMPHPRGLVGIDRSARPGSGTEFATIRPFQPGDRLRRIHWPSSLRSPTLNVSATYADSDSEVVLLVDASTDVGSSDGVDGAASALDHTVRAAAALAEHHLRRGDRVGLRVLGGHQPVRLPSSTGQAHLERILTTLARSRAGGADPEQQLDRRDRVAAGAQVLLCSPLVSSLPLQRAAALARRGLALIVVDTLPERIFHASDDRYVEVAWRVRLLERSVEIGRLLEGGIPVVPWRGPGSLDAVLRDVGRRARAPRLVQR